MNNEFVPKELSLKLKDIGFNEACFAYYVEEHNNVKIFSEPWSSNLTNTYDYFVGSDNFIPWSCTAPTINQVLRWFEKEHGMYVEWLIDMWGDDEKVTDEMICYTTFIWEIGKPKPSIYDEVGHGSWYSMALASIKEMIYMLNQKTDDKDELHNKVDYFIEQERRLIQMMQDDENDGLYDVE